MSYIPDWISRYLWDIHRISGASWGTQQEDLNDEEQNVEQFESLEASEPSDTESEPNLYTVSLQPPPGLLSRNLVLQSSNHTPYRPWENVNQENQYVAEHVASSFDYCETTKIKNEGLLSVDNQTSPSSQTPIPSVTCQQAMLPTVNETHSLLDISGFSFLSPSPPLEMSAPTTQYSYPDTTLVSHEENVNFANQSGSSTSSFVNNCLSVSSRSRQSFPSERGSSSLGRPSVAVRRDDLSKYFHRSLESL